jgi:DNA-binding MarR family transcriptional regulator
MTRATALTAEATPIGSLVELQVQLLKLSSLISKPMREGVAEPVGMATDEIKIVMCLGGEGAMAGHEINDLIAIPAMNVSRALSQLMHRGWIERTADTRDKRRKPVQLSKKGLEGYREMTPQLADVAQQLLGTLTQTERDVLGRASAKIIKRIEAWPAEHLTREA